MSEPLTVDIFVEDRAHEAFMKALVQRLASEVGRAVAPHVRTARGGHGRALCELSLYQRSALKALGGMMLPDMLVVAIDANCDPYQSARRQIESGLVPPFKDLAAVACPDPHVELWYLADLDAFQQIVGVRPRVASDKCERNYYKRILAKAVVDGGHPPTLGGVEFAGEIVNSMDLYRAGRHHRSLKRTVDDLRMLLRERHGA